MVYKCFEFYKSFAPAGIVITLACGYLYYTFGSDTLVAIGWFKLFTDVIIWYIMKQAKEKQLYYYYNQHISNKALWFVAFAFDMILLAAVLFIITPLPPHE